MKINFLKLAFGLTLLMAGCAPNSTEEFHREGEARCRQLVQDLEKIENREQLLRMEPQLKKHFASLVRLMIDAREFQQKHLEGISPELSAGEDVGDDSLQTELRRIYTIEGAREVIERSQQEALVRLDAYERTLSKKRGKPVPKLNSF